MSLYPATITDAEDGFQIVDSNGEPWDSVTAVLLPPAITTKIEGFRRSFKRGTRYRVEKYEAGHPLLHHYVITPLGVGEVDVATVHTATIGQIPKAEGEVQIDLDREKIATKATELSSLYRHHAKPEAKTLVIRILSAMNPEAAAATVEHIAAKAIAQIPTSCTIAAAHVYETVAPHGTNPLDGTRHYLGIVVITP